MSRIVIVMLIYHRHKPIDRINMLGYCIANTICIFVLVKYVSFIKSGLELRRMVKYVKTAGMIFELFI
jgi:hypothetical protein